jgi:hypothetical protein
VGTLSSYAKQDGTDYGRVETCSVFPDTIGAISFGAFASGACHFDIQDIKVGTTGWGASDLFAPVLNDLSEFDGLVNGGGGISASGGVLSIDDTTDTYGWKTIPDLVSIYVEFQLRVRTGDGNPDYQDIFETTTDASGDTNDITGPFNGGGHWRMDSACSGGIWGSGPTTDVWTTLQFYYSLATVGPAFHIAA